MIIFTDFYFKWQNLKNVTNILLVIVKLNDAKPAKFQKEVIHGPPKFATNISTYQTHLSAMDVFFKLPNKNDKMASKCDSFCCKF